MILQATQAEFFKKDNNFKVGSLHCHNFSIKVPAQTRLFQPGLEGRLKPAISANLNSKSDYIDCQTPGKEGGL